MNGWTQRFPLYSRGHCPICAHYPKWKERKRERDREKEREIERKKEREKERESERKREND